MSTRYFGIEIDSTLSWSCHIDFLFKSYSKKLGALKKECLAFHQEHLRRFILKQFYQESHIVSLSGVVVPHHSSINYKKSMPKQPYIFKQYLVQLTTSKSLNRQIGTHFHTSTKKSLLKHIHHVSFQIAPTQIQDLFTLRETKHKPR